jgi:cytochrome c-type biogenesis protein CcmF
MATRNRRRYGGYVIHLGVILMALGIIGVEMFQSETQGTLAYGDHLTLGDYEMSYDSLSLFATNDGREVALATISVYKNGHPVAELKPRRDYYVDSRQPMTIPGVYSTVAADFYVLLLDWKPVTSEGATFKIYLNPLVNWLWAGGMVFIVGTLIASWPQKRGFRARQPANLQIGTG